MAWWRGSIVAMLTLAAEGGVIHCEEDDEHTIRYSKLDDGITSFKNIDNQNIIQSVSQCCHMMSYLGQHISSLPTPAFIIDKEVVEANCR